MALDLYAVRALKVAIGNSACGSEIVTYLNLHGVGAPHTLTNKTKYALKTMFKSAPEAAPFITAVQGSTALAATDQARLGVALKNRRAAALIAAELTAS